MDRYRKALRAALHEIPLATLKVILDESSLTVNEKSSLLEPVEGADLIYLSQKLYTSDRTVDRLRASALEKLRRELEE